MNNNQQYLLSLRWAIILVYTHEVISTESERKPWKKRLVWFTGKFMREHVAVNSRCTIVGSLQYFQTWQIILLIFFVSFSINDWKENVEILNNSPLWEETQSFICFCQLTVSVVYLQCSAPCHVNLLTRTVFQNIYSPFFLHKLTSISSQNWSCEEIPSSHNSDKEASFFSVVVNKNIGSSVWKSSTVNHFAIKSRRLNTMKSFLTFKINNFGIFLYFKKVLTLKLGKTPSSQQRFCLACIQRLARWI